jgi:hypothetical protein
MASADTHPPGRARSITRLGEAGILPAPQEQHEAKESGRSVYRNDRPQRVCQASPRMVALLAVSHWRWFSLVAEVTR